MTGFKVRSRVAGYTVLARGDRRIVVPDALILSQPVLDAILDEADLSPERLLWLLGEVSTETELPFEA